MKQFLLITFLALFALAPRAGAQGGLQIDSLFNGSLVPASKVTESVVSGRELKPYKLDYFRSLRFQATDEEVEKIVSWVVEDSLLALNKEIDSQDGHLIWALLTYPYLKDKNSFLGFQVKDVAGKHYVTVVYMTGKATRNDLAQIFKHR